MEIKRKLMTDEQISQTEASLIEQVAAVREEYHSKFSDLGYELELEVTSKTDEDYDFSALDPENKNYPVGYISRATLTVKRPKTDEDEKKDGELAETLVEEAEELGAELDTEEAEPEESVQQTSDDEALADADRELKRSIAFTRVMLIRIYRTFWAEKISVCESIEQLCEDLDEFAEHLAKESLAPSEINE